MACIYSLRDPNKTPRYVGQSRNPETRYKWHIQAAKRGNKGRVYNWIRSLLKEGLMLDFEVLEDLGDAPQVEVDLAETRWITRLQLQGFDLTNCTMGGGGIAGLIRHVSSLGPLRAKLDWIAYHYHPRWWPRVTVDYWHSMHDLLDGVVPDASETLMFPARFFHS